MHPHTSDPVDFIRAIAYFDSNGLPNKQIEIADINSEAMHTWIQGSFSNVRSALSLKQFPQIERVSFDCVARPPGKDRIDSSEAGLSRCVVCDGVRVNIDCPRYLGARPQQ